MRIETKWHKIVDSVRARKVRLGSIDSFENPRFVPAEIVHPGILAAMLEEASKVPRFVLDPDILDLVATEQAMMSLGDMLACGVLHLPFGTCVVEFDRNNVSYSILLREEIGERLTTDWTASAFGYRGKALNDDAALVFPCRLRLSVLQTIALQEDTDLHPPEMPEIEYGIESEAFMAAGPEIELLMADAHQLLFERCMSAFLAAMILPNTVGLDREEYAVKSTFNKKRLAQGRSPVPPYTKIVFDKSAMTASGHGQAPHAQRVVHLRRAHKRRVAVGEGRSGRVWRFFPPHTNGPHE